MKIRSKFMNKKFRLGRICKKIKIKTAKLIIKIHCECYCCTDKAVEKLIKFSKYHKCLLLFINENIKNNKNNEI